MNSFDKGKAAGVDPANAKVFISYSRKDQVFADRLDEALKVRGFTPLIDRNVMYAFEDWWKQVEAQIEQSDTVVFVISPDAVASSVCRRELSFAISLNKRLAPVVCRRQEGMQVPEELSRLHFLDFDFGDFEQNADHLREALTTDIAWVRKHTELGALARRWESAGRPGPRGLLLRPPDLEEAERWIASRPHGAPLPTPATQTFIVESRRATTRRRNLLIGGLSAGLVLTLALSVVALRQREMAERNFDAARQTADGVVSDLAIGLRDVEGMRTETLRKILDRSADAYRKLSETTDGDVRILRSQAKMYVTFSETYASQGDLSRQSEAAQSALRILRALVEQHPKDAELRWEFGIAEEAVAQSLLAQKKVDEALKAELDVLTIFRSFEAEGRGKDATRHGLLRAYVILGSIHAAKGDLSAAIDTYGKGLAIANELGPAHPDDDRTQHEVSAAHEALGRALARKGDNRGALKEFRVAAGIAERMANLHPDETRWKAALSVFYMDIGIRLESEDELEEAYKNYGAGAQVADRLARQDPANPQWLFTMGNYYGHMGDVLVKADEPKAALDSYQRKLELMKRLEQYDYTYEPWLRHQAETLQKIGDTLLVLDRAPEAVRSFRDSLAVRERLAKAQPDDLSRQFALVDVQRRLAENGDDSRNRWKWIVDSLTKMRDDPRVDAGQRKWLIDALPKFQQELKKVQR